MAAYKSKARKRRSRTKGHKIACVLIRCQGYKDIAKGIKARRSQIKGRREGKAVKDRTRERLKRNWERY